MQLSLFLYLDCAGHKLCFNAMLLFSLKNLYPHVQFQNINKISEGQKALHLCYYWKFNPSPSFLEGTLATFIK